MRKLELYDINDPAICNIATIHEAFNHIAQHIYSPISKKMIGFNFALLLTGLLGNWPGIEYAENFSESFETYIFNLESGGFFEFFKDYCAFIYILVNEAIMLRSGNLTRDTFETLFKGKKNYQLWVEKTKYYVGVDYAQSVISVVLSLLAVVAIDEGNKSPDPTKSLQTIIFNYATRIIGDAVSGLQLIRSFNGLFNYFSDAKAFILPNGIVDRKNLHSLKMYFLKKTRDVNHDLLPLSNHTLEYVATGNDNPYGSFVKFATTVIAAATLIPAYTAINYENAAEENLQGKDGAMALAKISEIGMTVLFALSTGNMAKRFFDAGYAYYTKSMQIHSTELTKSSFITEPLKAGLFIAPSMFAAADRFARFSPFDLSSKSSVLKAFFNALRPAAVNYMDFTTCIETAPQAAAQFFPKRFNKKAVDLKYGESVKHLLIALMKKISTSDNFIRKIARPITIMSNEKVKKNTSRHSSQFSIRNAQINATEVSIDIDPRIEVTACYPKDSFVGLATNWFFKIADEELLLTFELTAEGIELHNDLTVIQAAYRNNMQVDELFDAWKNTAPKETGQATLTENTPLLSS